MTDVYVREDYCIHCGQPADKGTQCCDSYSGECMAKPHWSWYRLRDENKRLRERMEWMLEYIYSINPRCDTESELSITEIQGWFDDQGKVRAGRASI